MAPVSLSYPQLYTLTMADRNYMVIQGLRANSKVFVFGNQRYTFQKKLKDGGSRLKCTKWKVKDGGCRGSARLDAAERTITVTADHNHDGNSTKISENEFKNAVKSAIVSPDSNILQIYNDLATIYEITHDPNIRTLVPLESVQSTLYTIRSGIVGDDKECVLCMDRPWDHNIVGCGHTYCGVCINDVKNTTGICPKCRVPFENVSIIRPS